MKRLLWCVCVSAAIVFAVALLHGCCKPMPTPGVPQQTGPLSICLSSDPMSQPGSCGTKSTTDHFRCVLCFGDQKCETTSFEYCVDWKLACDDPRCR